MVVPEEGGTSSSLFSFSLVETIRWQACSIGDAVLATIERKTLDKAVAETVCDV